MNKFNTRRLLSFARQAVQHYKMIEDNDKIAVGVSGGKDSIALLITLAELRRFYPKKYELIAITIDSGFGNMDFTSIQKICDMYEIPYFLKKTEIAKVIFEERNESNPCSLCSKMRKGILYEIAKENGCNKVALGHHFDDSVQTFMLNLIHEGRIGSFMPVTYLSRMNLTLIRPMIYAKEKDIKYFISQNKIEVVKNTCPEDKNTEREEIKNLVKSLDDKYDGFSHRVMHALEVAQIDGYSICIKEKRTKDK